MGDAIGTGTSCCLWLSIYIFATYESVSVLRTDGHRQQTQTNAIIPELPSLVLVLFLYFNLKNENK